MSNPYESPNSESEQPWNRRATMLPLAVLLFLFIGTAPFFLLSSDSPVPGPVAPIQSREAVGPASPAVPADKLDPAEVKPANDLPAEAEP